jgi:hypothetical protein
MGGNFGRYAVGRTVQHDHRFSAHIDAAIIVQPKLRIGQAEADEDETRLDLPFALIQARRDRNLVTNPKADGLSSRDQRSGRRASLGGAAEGHLLEPASILSRRLKAERTEAACDIGGGNLMAALARAAPFEQIVREEFDMRSDPAFGSGLRRPLR